MAYELLLGKGDVHLYRHDLESLFYTMLLLCARHTFSQEKDEKTRKMTTRVVMRPSETRPYADWFDTGYTALGNAKVAFFTNAQPVGHTVPTLQGLPPTGHPIPIHSWVRTQDSPQSASD